MEVDKITTILKNNAYPKYVVNRALKDFTTKHQICEDNYCASKRNKPMATEIQDQTQAYLAVPYLGKPSLKFQSRIRKEMEKYGLNLISSYTTTKTSSYFSLKSNPPILFRSNVVYIFNCSSDNNVTYIGETRRHQFRRIIDHTGKDKKSAVLLHINQYQNCQLTENIYSLFEVLQQGTATNIYSLESMWIAKARPLLNTQMGPSSGRMVSLTLYK